MSLIKDKIKSLGYSQTGLANRLNINYRTFQRWLNYEHIDNFIKFIELLYILDVNIADIINEYKNKSQ